MAGPGGRFVEAAPQLFRRERGVASLVPDHLQRVAPAERRPAVGRENRDAVRDRDGAANAGNLLRLRGVEAHELSAGHRAPRDRREEHVGRPRVEAVLRAPGHDRRAVDPRHARPDDPEVLRVLQGRVPRNRKPGGVRGERAEPEAPARRRVHDEPLFRAALPGRHLPAAPGGVDQHRTGGRGGLAKHSPGRRDAVAAARAHVLVIGRRRSLLDGDGGPVGLELLGEDHREARADALSHLRSRDHERHAPVGSDAQPLVRREAGAGGRRGFGEQWDAQRGARRAREGPVPQEIPPRGAHRAPPSAPARRTARRIRAYVPQRQTCPSKAWSTSASVGRGVRASSAAASRIIPGWQ